MKTYGSAIGFIVVSALSTSALAGEFFLKPISATGAHTVNGSEIVLEGGGQIVTIELRMTDWASVADVGTCGDSTACSISAQDCAMGNCVGNSGLLSTYEARVDSAGYGGVLAPPVTACNVNADCGLFGSPFSSCVGNVCKNDSAGFIDSARTDYVFQAGSPIPAVDTSTDDWSFGSTLINVAASLAFAGQDKYGGTLILEVPAGVAGSFTIGFVSNPALVFMLDSGGVNIQPIIKTPVVITVKCQSNNDCDDGNACTLDSCNLGTGVCSNNDTTPSTQCCNPVDGFLTQIDDLNDCTADNCNADGSVDHPFLPSGTDCGGAPVDACDAQNSCNGTGTCVPAFAPSATACGSQANTECTDPDTCNGLGDCLPNHAFSGTICGNQDNTQCTNPDSCDGAGSCSNNHETNGTVCNDTLFCNVSESCQNGACSGGQARNCSDNVGCTNDSCDEINDVCVSVTDNGNCNNGQFCDGVEVCDAALDCIVQAGTVPDCNDLVACTDDSCDEVNDVCVNAANNANCDNGQFCDGAEFCDAQLDCQDGPPPPLDDGIDCTDDSCNEINNVVVHAPNDALCPDDALFCNGDEFCSAVTACDHTGSPCGGPCDEVNDTCLCDAPIVTVISPKYIRIQPQPAGSGIAQALVVTPDCPGGMPMFVSAPIPFDLDQRPPAEASLGFLSDTPVFLTPAQWGDTLFVTGVGLTPERSFVINGDCGSPGNPGLSDPAFVTMGKWADLNNDQLANFADIFGMVSSFQGIYALGTIEKTDITGGDDRCLPDQLPNFVDIAFGIGAFQQDSYFDIFSLLRFCPDPCP